MDNIDKLNLIFKANDIELGLQLVKSLELNLKDVIVELYDRYKFNIDNGLLQGVTVWWVFNSNDFLGANTTCIRDTSKHAVAGIKYTIWTNHISGLYIGKNCDNLDECFDLLIKSLEDGTFK